MPALVPHVPIDLHELLQDSAIAPGTLGGESGGIVEMAIYVALMLIVGVLRAEQSRADRAGKMFHMKLFICKTGRHQ